jgi:hypothetical protein
MEQKKIKRRVTRIKTGTQLGFEEFDSEPGCGPVQVEAPRGGIRFEDPDPREIRIGMQRWTCTCVRWGCATPWCCGRS